MTQNHCSVETFLAFLMTLNPKDENLVLQEKRMWHRSHWHCAVFGVRTIMFMKRVSSFAFPGEAWDQWCISSQTGNKCYFFLKFSEIDCFLFIASQLKFERCPSASPSPCNPGPAVRCMVITRILRALPQRVLIAETKTGWAAITAC